MNDTIKNYCQSLESIENSIATKNKLSDDEARIILEEILDALVEVGKGTSNKHLHKMADYLFAFRDKWFNMRNF